MADGARSSTIFIGNVPYDASEEQLRNIFGRVGTVESLRLVYDRDTKQPKGYGFCDFADSKTALSAIRLLKDVECNGRRIRIDLAGSAGRGNSAASAGCSAASGCHSALASSFRAVAGGAACDVPLPVVSLSSVSGPVVPPPGPPPAMSCGVVPARTPGLIGAGPPEGSADVVDEADTPEAVLASVSARTEIAQIVAAMPEAQVRLCLSTMQELVLADPTSARKLLHDRPHLCYALLHAQLLHGLSSTAALRPPPTAAEVRQLRQEGLSHQVPAEAPRQR